MTERRTYLEFLQGPGEPLAPHVPCPLCEQPRHLLEIVALEPADDLPGEWGCSTCILDRCREKKAEEEATAPEPGWDSELGNHWRARRTMLLDQHAWTIRADSPLTTECQAAFLAWFALWHRMTVDAPNPGAFSEPQMPTFEYAPLDVAAGS